MAMTAFAPAISRSKAIITEKSNQVVFRLVPDISAGKQANRKYFAKFVSAIGTLGLALLLFVNTLLAQDAFELNHLKLEVKLISDQREAINRTIDEYAAPAALADAANKLGMRPSENPIFLKLDNPLPITQLADHG